MVKKWVIVTVLTVMVLIGSFCNNGENNKPKTVEQINDLETLQKGNQVFALELYNQVSKNNDNIFFSPYSISTALAMTYAGARNETEKQMAKTMHFDLIRERLHPTFHLMMNDLNNREKGYQLNIANALWGQKDNNFLKSFIDIMNTNYEAGLHEIDFKGDAEKARKIINNWIEKQTKDKIKELIQPGVINNLTTLILTNAIYFKGDWNNKFDKKRTKNSPFTLMDGNKVDARRTKI
jgi:serpin B